MTKNGNGSPEEGNRSEDVPKWARRRKQPRDPRTGFLRPCRCELYLAGHTVHYIQAIHSAGKPHRFGRLVALPVSVGSR